MADFHPGGFPLQGAPCAHSAGRVGFGYPVPFTPPPDAKRLYSKRLHWIVGSLFTWRNAL